MKKILMLHSSSDLYGASKIFLNTIDVLKECSEIVVCLSEKGPLVDEIRSRGIDLDIIELGIIRRKYFNFLGILNRLFFLLIGIIRLSHLCRKNKIDLIYSNTTAVWIGAYVAKLNRVKHVWHIHEIIKTPKKVAQFIAWNLRENSTNNICVSNEVLNYWVELQPSLMKKITLIYNGLDFSGFGVKTSKLRKELKLSSEIILIGMVARINHWKGQGYFIDIANKLLKEFSRLHFVLIGDVYPGYENYEREMYAKILKYNIQKNVTILGFRSDVKDILPDLNIFVLPSILPDPLPTTVLEAMASKCPVVATNHGGAREMVKNGETGYLIPWDNATEACSIMKNLVLDRELQKEMGQKGLHRVTDLYTIEKYKRNIHSFIEEVYS
jgi:glycosyltransferase involved in cell wall biosynthesis